MLRQRRGLVALWVGGVTTAAARTAARKASSSAAAMPAPLAWMLSARLSRILWPSALLWWGCWGCLG